ncbi:MAG: MBL fold metallo-hydrolase [Balneolaceae bacterium]|nr:MBL fold metallo-hydrolase [Balneolaceae bacterium]
MDRHTFLKHAALAVAGAALPFRERWGNTPVQRSFQPLRRNVGIYTERGGTIGWLAADDAFAVVDTQYPESARNCLAGLEERTGSPLNLLINTHHHGDHVGGNPVFKPRAEQTVAHREVPGLMEKSNEDADTPNTAYPETTYSDTWKTELGTETVHLAHYGPAHTGGDTVIYFEKANISHMGDLVFNRMNPYTDRPSGASVHNWITVLETVADDLPGDAIYIFGHGKPEFGVTGNRSDLLVMRDYLAAMVEHVESGIESGRSKEEITNLQQMKQFPSFQYADWWTL